MFDIYDETDDFEFSQRIGDFSGECKFWNNEHVLSKLNSELFDRLVPDEGESETVHGELLRMVNRLCYDIFNNGMCNDKREEISYLRSNLNLYQEYLEDSKSSDILYRLAKTYRNGSSVDMNQAHCDWLDDVIQAVVRYVAKQESATV